MNLHKYSTSTEVRKHYRMELGMEDPFQAMRLHLKKYYPHIEVSVIKDHLLEREFNARTTQSMETL